MRSAYDEAHKFGLPVTPKLVAGYTVLCWNTQPVRVAYGQSHAERGLPWV